MPIRLDGAPLRPADVVAVARDHETVVLDPTGLERLHAGRRALEHAIGDGLAHYGVNTGFGSLARTRVQDAELRDLQHNLICSHAAGSGPLLDQSTVRAMMLLLAASLTRGASGVRPLLVERLVELLNRGITPQVPSVGSVGASGDLAPLAHAALALIGVGDVHVGDRSMSSEEALRDAGLDPIEFAEKEGLALINGTHLMAAMASLAIGDLGRVLDASIQACAMSIDGCKATNSFLHPSIYDLRGHPGPRDVASFLRTLLEGSGIMDSHREGDERVQDPYSFRCAPIVIGSALDGLRAASMSIERELGAVTDNPLLIGDEIISAGNFHGMPLAIPLDSLAIVAAHIAGISERRTFWMLAARDAESGLNPYLTPKPGVCSGMMIAQYTAAACCNEIIGLATPASVANISTSAGIEDYNSFGPRAGAKLHQVIDRVRTVIAVELLCAAEAIEYHRPLRSGDGVEKAHETIRTRVGRLTVDRVLAPDIASIEDMIRDGAFDLARDLS